MDFVGEAHINVKRVKTMEVKTTEDAVDARAVILMMISAGNELAVLMEEHIVRVLDKNRRAPFLGCTSLSRVNSLHNTMLAS